MKRVLFRNYNKEYDVDIHIWKEKLSTMHGHTYYEFAICNKGEIIHYLNDDEPRMLKKGQAFFITPEDRHAIKALSGARHINIAFLPSIFMELCRYFELVTKTKVFKNATITLGDEDFERIIKQVNDVLKVSDEQDESLYIAKLKHLVEELFFIFLKEQSQTVAEKKPKWLRDFVAKVSTVEFFSCPIAELYAYANYSQPIVTKAFKKYYGITFIQYFTEQRILYACGLLKNTNLGVLEICNMVGFSSLSHFNAVFKRLCGDTPGRFRKSDKKYGRGGVR